MKRFQILDKTEEELLKKYKRLNKLAQDEIEDLLNEIVNTNSNKPISKTKKDKLNRYIEEKKEQGIYSLYVLFLCIKILNKTKVFINDFITIKLLLIYDEKYKKIDEINKKAFKDIIYSGYNDCVHDIKEKKKKVNIDALLILFLSQINGGYNYYDYINARIQYEANQIKRMIDVSKQQKKEVDINSPINQRTFELQVKQFLNINDNKRSGFIEIIGSSLYNKGYVQACKDYSIKRVQFIAVMDNNTTDVCRSMDLQVFYLDKMNIYYRYDEELKNIVLTRTFGLIPGINQPPITTTYHPCRSYLIAIKYEKNNILEIPKIDKDVNKLLSNVKLNNKVKKLFNKYLTSENIIINSNDNKPMYYDIDKDKIVINPKHEDFKEYNLEEALTHEIMHMIDHRNNIYINIDINNELRRLELDFSANEDKYNKIFDNNIYKNNMCLSDLFSAISNNKIEGNFYHKNSYWKNQDNKINEILANIETMYLTNDKKALQIIDSINSLKQIKRKVVEKYNEFTE